LKGYSSDALQTGKALLLIDGLDEISNESSRLAFVSQLRIFLAVYPSSALVVTSREAGFRIVGTALSADCDHYTLAPLDESGVRSLINAWYAETVGNTKDAKDSSARCWQAISSNDRIGELATNPLLLTTILLIRRWVTQLPTKRSALYAKAVEILLISWNVEGHLPLDQDEVIPQLAFVALEMMKQGIQRIFQSELHKLLQAARAAMPDVLAFSKTSPSDLISRVELRSSLLLQSGSELHNGTLQPLYEFRHLLFQEFLAAKAIVESYSRDGLSQSIEEALTPFLADHSWEEVIALTAPLSGRRADRLISGIVRVAEQEQAYVGETNSPARMKEFPIRSLLAECLADEVPLGPSTLDAALRAIVPVPDHELQAFFRSRYVQEFYNICVQMYFDPEEKRYLTIGSHIAEIGMLKLAQQYPVRADQLGEIARRYVEPHAFIETTYLTMEWAYQSGRRGPDGQIDQIDQDTLATVIGALLDRINSADDRELTAILWALSWLGSNGVWRVSNDLAIYALLFKMWGESENPIIARLSAWSISVAPIYDPIVWPTIPIDHSESLLAKLNSINQPVPTKGGNFPDRMAIVAALLGSVYLGIPLRMKKSNADSLKLWTGSDEKLVKLLKPLMPD
jgi:hypothetical protein